MSHNCILGCQTDTEFPRMLDRAARLGILTAPQEATTPTSGWEINTAGECEHTRVTDWSHGPYRYSFA